MSTESEKLKINMSLSLVERVIIRLQIFGVDKEIKSYTKELQNIAKKARWKSLAVPEGQINSTFFYQPRLKQLKDILDGSGSRVLNLDEINNLEGWWRLTWEAIDQSNYVQQGLCVTFRMQILNLRREALQRDYSGETGFLNQ